MDDRSAARSGTGSDRVAGAVLIVVALWMALESRDFTVGFVTDPLGPKAFPLLAAGLMLVAGVCLLVRPAGTSAWPQGRGLLRLVAAVICLLSYALLLTILGFFTTTMLGVSVFALLLGGRPVQALLAAAAISATLYVLFSYLLNVALPLGSLFVRGG
jgi:putative tricarboxylic transport membrane protein